MKRILFLFLAFVPLMLRSQVDTLFMGDREPTFYYWGNWWVDYIYANTDKDFQEEYMNAYYVQYGPKAELARCCFSLDTLKVIGVAVAAKLGIFPKDTSNWFYKSDSSILPEYCRIFKYHGPTEEESPFLAEARYDDFVPRYITDCGNGVFAPIYEAYFKSAVPVVDTFYVSATQNNNYKICDTVWFQFADSLYLCCNCYYAHPRTGIYINLPWPTPYGYIFQPPLFGRNLKRLQYGENVAHCNDLYGEQLLSWHDMSKGFFWDTIKPKPFLFIFPIFDTATCNVDSTTASWCMAPNNLRAPMPDAESTVLLWNSTNGSEWDVSLCKGCMEPDSGVITHSTTTFANITGLEAGASYTAWVRAYCNENDTSFWSEGLQFTVPMPADTGGTEYVFNVDDAYFMLSPNPASERVSAFSSFQIRELDIYSMSGKLVRHVSPRALSVSVDVSDLPKGLYIVRATTIHGMAYGRLVIG